MSLTRAAAKRLCSTSNKTSFPLVTSPFGETAFSGFWYRQPVMQNVYQSKKEWPERKITDSFDITTVALIQQHRGVLYL
jgi:hypothetical protein